MGTALVTPFREDKSIDFETLERLVGAKLYGADFIVVLGTTAGNPTLSEVEQDEVIERTTKVVKGRIPLVVGISHNGTMRVNRAP